MNSLANKSGIETVENEFYIQWHITEKCNLRCKHCYHDHYSSDNELASEELISIADKIGATLTKWNKIGTLSITGGEPFVVKDKLLPLLRHIDALETIHHFDLYFILAVGAAISGKQVLQIEE